MSAYQKEWILGILFVIIVILHVDFWAWNAVYPILFGFMPYSVWWGIIVQLLVVGMILWWNKWGWPAPPEKYEHEMSSSGEVQK